MSGATTPNQNTGGSTAVPDVNASGFSFARSTQRIKLAKDSQFTLAEAGRLRDKMWTEFTSGNVVGAEVVSQTNTARAEFFTAILLNGIQNSTSARGQFDGDMTGDFGVCPRIVIKTVVQDVRKFYRVYARDAMAYLKMYPEYASHIAISRGFDEKHRHLCFDFVTEDCFANTAEAEYVAQAKKNFTRGTSQTNKPKDTKQREEFPTMRDDLR